MSFTCWECGNGMSDVDDSCGACGTRWDADDQAIQQAKILWEREWAERFAAPAYEA